MSMMKLATLALVIAAACGGSKSPAPATAAPEPAAGSAANPMSPEECTAKGGTVKGDIGDGKVACDEGQTNLGRVNQGIEGAVCCATAAP